MTHRSFQQKLTQHPPDQAWHASFPLNHSDEKTLETIPDLGNVALAAGRWKITVFIQTKTANSNNGTHEIVIYLNGFPTSVRVDTTNQRRSSPVTFAGFVDCNGTDVIDVRFRPFSSPFQNVAVEGRSMIATYLPVVL